MEKRNEKLQLLEEKLDDFLEKWAEIENILEKATKQTYECILEDSDDDFILKRSTLFLFISRVHYVFHQEYKVIQSDIQKLESSLNSKKD